MAHFPLIKELFENPLIKTRQFAMAGRREKMLPAKKTRRLSSFFLFFYNRSVCQGKTTS